MSTIGPSRSALVSEAQAILENSRQRTDWVGPARNAYDLRLDEFRARLGALAMQLAALA